MPTSISHIIFDWNGTLINDIDVAVEGVNRVRAHQQLVPIDRQKYREDFGFPIQGFYERLGIDFSRLSFSALAEIYLGHFNQAIKACTLHAGAADLIAWARQNQIRISVLSASQQDTLHANLAHAGLSGLVDDIYGLNGSEAHGKLDLARRLDAHLGHPGEAALMIGDTDHDVEVARACGWSATCVSHGHQTAERLASAQVLVFSDLLSTFKHHFPQSEFAEVVPC